MKVIEFIKWLSEQDQDATVEVNTSSSNWYCGEWYTDTFIKEFNPSITSWSYNSKTKTLTLGR